MRIAYISTYLPRECGIATFNDNEERAILANFPDQTIQEDGFGIAINDLDELNTYD
ncbi:hypothetical protein [Pontibacter qinzhouensis]|uniref:hypothetical protein n=1 Tax=Pontibacter qinzhouensis TaxID=2603253 RepID=UPI002105EE04|nr:hypothetical protein [Pontibacter qinzhouensis]